MKLSVESIAIPTMTAVMTAVGAAGSNWKAEAKNNRASDVFSDSLIEYTQPTRIEPLTLVEQNLWREPYMEDLMQTLLNIFSGYYMQAVALAAEIKGISITKRLERFNPKRDPLNNLADAVIGAVALEDGTKFGLPSLENMNVLAKANQVGAINWSVHSTEAMRVDHNPNPMSNEGIDEQNDKPARGAKSISAELVSKETLQALRDNSNLAVGKMLEVTVAVDESQIKVPVNVRLQTVPVPTRSMTLFLTAGAQNRSLKERWYEFKADKLTFFADLIGVRDLLDEHRKNIIKDETGLYLKQIQQKRKNTMAGLISGRPSVASASNIVVITEEQRVILERELNIKLSTLAGRRTLERNSGIMLLVVVDRSFEQVEIFHRGIEGSTELSINAMKNASKNTGPDVMKIFEMYKSMKAPTF